MRVFGPILMVFAAVITNGAEPLQACGDKFLLVGRAVTYHRAYGAVYPASILVYAPPQRDAAKAIRDPRLQSDLKRAGHRVVMVESDAALTRALESDRVDLLLTDVADADRLSKQFASTAAAPSVLPVMYEPTKDEAKQVEARYHCQLKSSDRADRFLSSIDDAMKARVALKKKSS
jgi:hypothetical protein